jgi:thiosulfate reductase cytochrome b subunit
VGNDLTLALIELPINRNHRHGGWEKPTPFLSGLRRRSARAGRTTFSTKTAGGRSLHFPAAWVLALTGVFYLLAGLYTCRLVPRFEDIGESL